MTQILSNRLNGPGREHVLQVADPVLNICRKWPKKMPLVWLVCIPRISIDGAICIGTDLDGEQTPLITV